MKPCFYCAGKKVRYTRDPELRITITCEKCGAKVETPCLTEDSARGYWNMKQYTLEEKKKREQKEAAG